MTVHRPRSEYLFVCSHKTLDPIAAVWEDSVETVQISWTMFGWNKQPIGCVSGVGFLRHERAMPAKKWIRSSNGVSKSASKY